MNRSSEHPKSDFKAIESAHKALERSESKLRAVLETAVEGIITINQHGIIESLNPAAERMFGYSASELVGQNVKLLMPSPYQAEHDSYLSNYLRTGSRKIIGIGREVVGRRKDDSVFPMYLSVAEMRFESEPHFAGIVRDLSDEKHAQERLLQAERLAAIGQMVAALTHESRNYLQRISYAAEVLQVEVKGNLEARKDVAKILKANQSLAELLEEVRSFASPIKLDTSSWCLARIWRGVWADMERSVQPQEVVFHEELNDVDTNCMVDDFRLEQVFRNLFENSLMACTEPVRIEVHCSNTRIGSQSALRVSVRDNGPGLTQAQARQVFEPFFTTKSKGTGLGLSIVRRLIEAHGGQIVVGEKSGGAEFIITLPR